MQQNKNNSKKRKSKKTRKPKVYIPAYKIIILCSIIILICMTLLLITTIKSSKDTQASSIAERYEKTAEEQNKSTLQELQKSSENQDKSKNEQKTEKKQEKVKTQKPPKITEFTDEKINQKKVSTPQKEAEKIKKEQQNNEQKTKIIEQPTQKSTEITEKKSDLQKTSKYDFPSAKNNAQLIFVFDDGGQNISHLETFLQLPIPITIAVLPCLEYSKQSAQKIRNSKNELILHQPMQAINPNINPGPGAITPKMTEDEIIATLFRNINEIGPVAGMNNHEGSAVTADAEKMSVILKFASEEGIYFLDSRTNSQTKVPYISKQLGYSYYERNIFLDNEKTNQNALNELKKGLDFANKNGSVIMIGHIWSADFLPNFILEVLPELQEKGYTFCTVSESNAIKY